MLDLQHVGSYNDIYTTGQARAISTAIICTGQVANNNLYLEISPVALFIDVDNN